MASREAGQEDSCSVKDSSGEGDLSRAGAAHPQASNERGKSQREDGDRERQRNLRNRPAECFGERDAEDAPGIDGAERDLNDDASNCDGPAIGFRSGWACHWCEIRALRPVLQTAEMQLDFGFALTERNPISREVYF